MKGDFIRKLGGFDKSKPLYDEIESVNIAELLQRNGMPNLSSDPVYLTCLIPLLKALGWKSFLRELIESLPHFADKFELPDLRNVMANMGYDSRPERIDIQSIREELLPCLYAADSGAVYVVEHGTSSEMRFFDPVAEKYLESAPPATEGTAYFFTDNRGSAQDAWMVNSSPNWFGDLLARFRPMVVHLLTTTLCINLMALIVPIFIMIVYDKVIGSKSLDSLPYLLVGVAVVIGMDLGMRLLRARILGHIAGRIEYLLGVNTFRQILMLPPALTEKSAMSSQLARLRQFDSVRDFFTGATATTVLDLPFSILFLALIGVLGGWIALVPLLTLGAYFLFGALWLPIINSRVLRAGRARSDRQRLLMETFSGRREIKASAAESSWVERYREVSGEAATAQYETVKANAIMTAVAGALMTVSGTAVLAFGTLGVINQTMTIGALIAIMALVWRVLSPLQNLFLSYTKLDQILQTIRQVNQLMTLAVETDTAKSALLMPEIRGGIKFDRVSFRYGPQQDPALLGASFSVEPGEMVAITGPTGAGKSTILKLVAGMYRPQGGSLLLDRTDIRQISPMDLRRAIAYLPQQPRLFFGSVSQNIRLTNMLASDDDLMAAAERAGVLESILAMPKGFDTALGDNIADRLPPGFVQGLCMARVYLRNAPILLLDEPGASLDYEADSSFMKQLNEIKGKSTVVMVSHRPSHIRLADIALIADRGTLRVCESPDEAVAMMLGAAA